MTIKHQMHHTYTETLLSVSVICSDTAVQPYIKLSIQIIYEDKNGSIHTSQVSPNMELKHERIVLLF